MTESLFNAIYARYLATELADKLDALYNTEAPEGAVFPYGTFSLDSNVPEWTFTENSENCVIQFNLFSKTPQCDEVLDAVAALKAAFDFFDLVVDGYTTVSLTRMLASLVRVEEVWLYNVKYRLLIQKG